MDIILTHSDARRAYRIARGRNATFGIVPIAWLPMPPKSDFSSWTEFKQVVLSALENLGIAIPEVAIEVRSTSRTAKGRRCDRLITHTNAQTLPPGSFRQIIPRDSDLGHELYASGIRILVDCPELCLIDFAAEEQHKAGARSGPKAIEAFGHTLAFAAELCGRYACNAMSPAFGEAHFDGVEPVMTAESLKAYLAQTSRLNGQRLARSVADWIAEGQGSPREVALYALLVLPTHLGGLHLVRPVTNEPLDLTVREQNVISHIQITPDLYWKLYQLVVEYDGGIHNEASAVIEDKRRVIDYQSLGIMVLPVTNENFRTLEAIKDLLRLIVRQMAKVEGPKLTHRVNRLMRDQKHQDRMQRLWKSAGRTR